MFLKTTKMKPMIGQTVLIKYVGEDYVAEYDDVPPWEYEVVQYNHIPEGDNIFENDVGYWDEEDVYAWMPVLDLDDIEVEE